MTIAYNKDTDLERELTARLSELAHAFIADLNAQGRLVETGGADTLRRLRQQQPTPPAELNTEPPGDAGREVTGTEAHPAPGATLWEAVTAPRSAEDTPRPPTTPRPLHILGAYEPCPAGANVPDSYDTPAAALEPALVQQPAAPGPVTGQSTGTQEQRTPDGSQAEPQAPAERAAARAPAPARQQTSVPALAAARRPVALGPVTGQNSDVRGPRTADAGQTQSPTADRQSAAPAQQPAALEPVPAQSTGAQEPGTPDEGQTQPSAAVTAARLRAENAARLEVTQITADDERVDVHIHAVSLGDWEYWLSAIGAPLNAPTQRSGWVQTATGYLDGVEVHLAAEAVPRLLQEAVQQAADPFVLGGRVYDLALGHTDRLGQTWLYDGLRQEDDTPLLALGGTSGPPYPLTSIVVANGPLTPAAAHPDHPDHPETG
ncbi:BN159_2729 family protein [Streptomyces sp. NPDC005706]|uniref:BN159_2729 family protein n=1 Tax=Streptomyces sp. NPDC005706 TaxID=3157169 RepID=UPI0033D797AA